MESQIQIDARLFVGSAYEMLLKSWELNLSSFERLEQFEEIKLPQIALTNSNLPVTPKRYVDVIADVYLNVIAIGRNQTNLISRKEDGLRFKLLSYILDDFLQWISGRLSETFQKTETLSSEIFLIYLMQALMGTLNIDALTKYVTKQNNQEQVKMTKETFQTTLELVATNQIAMDEIQKKFAKNPTKQPTEFSHTRGNISEGFEYLKYLSTKHPNSKIIYDSFCEFYDYVQKNSGIPYDPKKRMNEEIELMQTEQIQTEQPTCNPEETINANVVKEKLLEIVGQIADVSSEALQKIMKVITNMEEIIEEDDLT